MVVCSIAILVFQGVSIWSNYQLGRYSDADLILLPPNHWHHALERRPFWNDNSFHNAASCWVYERQACNHHRSFVYHQKQHELTLMLMPYPIPKSKKNPQQKPCSNPPNQPSGPAESSSLSGISSHASSGWFREPVCLKTSRSRCASTVL